MYPKERINLITEILRNNGFVTVKFLVNELHYSSATINRDLNIMQNLGIIKRSFGGVELVKKTQVPLYFRYSKMRPIKNNIAKKAAEYINNGDTVFIDCSTTAQYIGKYITDKKELTVITNNIALASFLSEYDIKSICLGGEIIEAPYMVYSAQTVENAKRYGADKFFFSAGGITADGKIQSADFDNHTLLIRAMLENAKQNFLLFDREKINDKFNKYLGTFAEVNNIITDYIFSDEVKQKYKNTKFIEV